MRSWGEIKKLTADRNSQNPSVSSAGKSANRRYQILDTAQAGGSSIPDANMALDVSATTRGQILTQSSTAMLVQANQVPQRVIALLN